MLVTEMRISMGMSAPSIRALAPYLAKEDFSDCFRCHLPNVDISNRRWQAGHLRVVEPQRQDVFLLFSQGARLRVLPFKLGPRLADIVLRDEHRTETCLLPYTFAK